MSYHLTPQDGHYIRTTTENNKCWQGCGEIRTLCPAGGNIKWCNRCTKQYGSYSNIKNRTPILCSNPISEYIPERMESRNEKDMCTPLLIAAVFTIAKKVERTQMFIDGWTNKCGTCTPWGITQPSKGR